MCKYQIAGYFSKNQCENIKSKLEGKTFMNFHIEFGGIANNNSMIVTSNAENYTDDELKEMFIYYTLTSL